MAGALGTMTPEQLSKIPGGTPPPGVQPNFVNPPSSAPGPIAVGAVLMTMMLIFAGIRFSVKAIVRHKATPDDWTTVAAVASATLVCESLVYGFETTDGERF
ncbi:hypothetical protein DL764_001163 [Monosporascus ibericus]|uniref:Uncharacterized protein n=1 Tax=Monosporascus ibericus TaxID=155417 RepID=A0A4Q4TQN1_9PEZI|nr:hypothetical protein DL764_001163 [Monosporascus ibericus]